MFVCLFICLFVCLLVCLLVCLFVYLFVCLFRDNNEFVVYCLNLLKLHLKCAVFLSNSQDSIGREIIPLGQLLFKLMDSSTPQPIQNVGLGTKQPHFHQNSINTNIIRNVYPRIIAPQSSELNFTVTSRIIGFYRILTHFDNQTTITIRVLLRGVIFSKNRRKVNNRPGYYSSSVFVVF